MFLLYVPMLLLSIGVSSMLAMSPEIAKELREQIQAESGAQKRYLDCLDSELLGKKVPKNIVDKSLFNLNDPLEKGDLYVLKVNRIDEPYYYIYGCFRGAFQERMSILGKCSIDYALPHFIIAKKEGHLVGFYASKSDYAKVPYGLLLLDFTKRGNLDQVMTLAERGANLDTTDEDQRTPLMYATLKGDYQMVKFLLDLQADTSISDVEGHGALDIALARRDLSKEHEKVYKILVEKEESRFKNRITWKNKEW